MIQEFVKCWDERKTEIEAFFKEKHPENYAEIVRLVFEILGEDSHGDKPNPCNIREINDGDCQGTFLYIVACDRYQPHEYWYVKVWYGSCSGCDTLEGIRYDIEEKPTDSEVSDYMALALHILQNIKKMEG